MINNPFKDLAENWTFRHYLERDFVSKEVLVLLG